MFDEFELCVSDVIYNNSLYNNVPINDYIVCDYNEDVVKELNFDDEEII